MTERQVEDHLAAAPYRVGQMVTTVREVRIPNPDPHVNGTIFEPGTRWKIARVFVQEMAGNKPSPVQTGLAWGQPCNRRNQRQTLGGG